MFENYEIEGTDVPEPVVSVVLPTFNSSKTLRKAIDSILSQTFTDWEMLVINDLGSDDGTADIVREYIGKDSRIKLVQAKERLGLADSLNLGLQLSRGRYVARMDSDDYSLPRRFEKQIRILEKNEEIGICGTWQRHIGKSNWVHRAAPEDSVCRARLLFWCDLCHSTLMLRKDVFIFNDLYYDRNYKAEDYELWTRAMEFTRIRNIPEILGIYSDEDGITNDKLDELSTENGIIVANTLHRLFGMELDEDEKLLFRQWNYSVENDPDRDDKLESLERILREIWFNNQKMEKIDGKALLIPIANVWYKSRYGSNIGDRTFIYPRRIDDVFDGRFISSKIIKYRVFRRKNSGVLNRIKGLFNIMFGQL